MFVVYYFYFVRGGACGWVVSTADHMGWFHPVGVGLLANCRAVLMPLATNIVTVKYCVMVLEGCYGVGRVQANNI